MKQKFIVTSMQMEERPATQRPIESYFNLTHGGYNDYSFELKTIDPHGMYSMVDEIVLKTVDPAVIEKLQKALFNKEVITINTEILKKKKI